MRPRVGAIRRCPTWVPAAAAAAVLVMLAAAAMAPSVSASGHERSCGKATAAGYQARVFARRVACAFARRAVRLNLAGKGGPSGWMCLAADEDGLCAPSGANIRSSPRRIRFDHVVQVASVGASSLLASASSARVCGKVRHPGGWQPKTGRVYALSSSVSCRASMRVARAAVAHNFSFGETVSTIPGWVCRVTNRPEVGFSPRFLLGCFRGGGSKLLVGVK